MTMKIFQTIQTKFAVLGLKPNLRPFNNLQKLILFENFVQISSLCVYLFHVANTAKEYLESIHITATTILIVTSQVNLISQMATIFSFIDELEDVLNESKFELLFDVLVTHIVSSVLYQIKNLLTGEFRVSKVG